MDRLDELALLFDRHRRAESDCDHSSDPQAGSDAESAAVLGGALARASALRGVLRDGSESEQLALTLFVARALSGLWVQRRWSADDVRALLEDAAAIAGQPVEAFTLGVSLYTLCDPTLLELPPRLAIEAQIELLRALARIDNVSLWLRDPDGRVRCHVHAGPGTASRRMCEVAKAALEGRDGEVGKGRVLFGVAVMRWQQPHAALVGRVMHGGRDRGLAFLDQAAAMIGPMLERLSLLERNAARESSLVKATERRLTRLGFDLHDQPLQEVAALATELHSFRQQLASANGGPEHRDLLIGRVHDFEARLTALDEGLRSLCHSLEPPTLLARPLPQLLQREIDGYAARTEMDVELSVEGNLDDLSDSQRIALVRIIQECLSNAREHSGADRVRVELRANHSHVEASVTDNGRGFDVERTLLQAAQRGRLGLVGVHERVRLLGGTCEVTSKPGGPTTVAVRLSQWQRLPLSADVESRAS